MTLNPDQFKQYTGDASKASEWWKTQPTRELVSEMKWNSQRMNDLTDRGHGAGWDLPGMNYEPGKYAYSGHMALMVRDVAFDQRNVADAFAAKGIHMPVLDMLDTQTRDNWTKRRRERDE